LVALVDQELRLVVRMIVGENAARFHARGRLEVFGLGVGGSKSTAVEIRVEVGDRNRGGSRFI